jgi:hypothetical protein
MRTGEAFVLGTITGAVVVWLWGRELGAYAADSTRGVRATAADGMRAVEEKAGTSLRRAEEFLDGTKKRVGGALRAAQKAIRPARTTGTA